MSFDDYRNFISTSCHVTVHKIKEESSFRDDLDIDSLRMVNLLLELAEKFGVKLSEINNFNDVRTVGSLYQTFLIAVES